MIHYVILRRYMLKGKGADPGHNANLLPEEDVLYVLF
jgi:hypothetical protein